MKKFLGDFVSYSKGTHYASNEKCMAHDGVVLHAINCDVQAYYGSTIYANNCRVFVLGAKKVVAKDSTIDTSKLSDTEMQLTNCLINYR